MNAPSNYQPSERSVSLAARVEQFVHEVVIPYERDARLDAHGPQAALVQELRAHARAARLMTPHVLHDGSHLTQVETALVLRKSGLSPLGPVALNTAAPDEGNMYLIGKVGTPAQQERFLAPLHAGTARSAFFTVPRGGPLRAGDGRHGRVARHGGGADFPRDPWLSHLRRPHRSPQVVDCEEDQARRPEPASLEQF